MAKNVLVTGDPIHHIESQVARGQVAPGAVGT